MTDDVHAVWPLLWVSDIESTISLWIDGLGFELVGADGPVGGRDWCRLVRGGASVMLQAGDSGGGRSPVALYFICVDVDGLRGELLERGVEVGVPVDAVYGMRQLRIPHPDGHEIWFETPTR